MARAQRLRWWPVLLFTAVASLVFLRSWSHPTTVIPGFPDDNKSFLWGLQWFAFALSHGHDPFVTDYIHAPAGINVLWNAWTPLLATILAPLTLVAGPDASYDVLVTASFALSGIAGWRAASRFVRPGTAAFVGLAYELCPYMLGHGGEDPMLVFALFPPIVLLLGTDLLQGRRTAVRTGVFLGVATAAQVWVDEEVVTDVALVAACALLVGLVVARGGTRAMWRMLATTGAVAGGVALVLASPALLIQFLGPDRIRTLIRSPEDSSFVDLADIFQPPSTVIASYAKHSPVSVRDTVETTGYLGLLPVPALLGALSSWRRRRPVLLLALVALVTGVLSLGVNLTADGYLLFYPLPWDGLSRLPLLGQLQPGRLTLEVFLLVAVLSGIGFEHVAARHRWPAMTLALLTAVSLVPVLPAVGTTRTAAPEFFRDGARAVPSGCLVAVAPVAYAGTNDDAMVWQAAADFRFRMMGGYVLGPIQRGQSGTYAPQPYPLVAWLVRHGGQSAIVPRASDAQARADIASLGVCDVVVGHPDQHAELVTSIDRMLGSSPELTGGVAIWPTRP